VSILDKGERHLWEPESAKVGREVVGVSQDRRAGVVLTEQLERPFEGVERGLGLRWHLEGTLVIEGPWREYGVLKMSRSERLPPSVLFSDVLGRGGVAADLCVELRSPAVVSTETGVKRVLLGGVTASQDSDAD
jgi:hypothetical protein